MNPVRPASLALPPSTPEPSKPGFPWIASLAPVAGALAVWAITGSAFALLFATLGPLVAIATMLDARRHGARTRRRALAERARAIERLRSEVSDRHDLERDAAWRRTPSARETARRAVPAWRLPAPGGIVVGTGTAVSELRVEGVAAGEGDARLLDEASVLRGAPIRVDAADGVGFVGVADLARAAARAAVVQCADAVSPEFLAVESTGGPWEWLASLPHHSSASAGSRLVVDERSSGPRPAGSVTDGAGAGGEGSVIAVADHAGALPPGLGAVVHLASPRMGVLTSIGRPPVDLVPELLSSAEAADWAGRVERAARRAGLAARGGVLPEHVALRDLPRAPTHALRGRAGLRVGVGIGADGPLELDLAAGPHALVAGTSGSGKSEFLLAWLTALALAYGPDRVAFLLVDFKGGAAFEPIAGLPHVTGIVTDLDEQEAARAVVSIRAELRRREQVLRSAGARDLAVLDERIELPRLVVVVDEFQAMVERFPELGEVIADVAARGRSLGVHLVLASQRPNGVVRDQVTANCGIRVSLRVLQRSDSLAIVGTDAAALIEPGRPGRAVADPGDGRAVPFQSAQADAESIDRALRRHADTHPPRRPWLDPLPRTVTLETIGAVLAHGRPASPASMAVARGDDPGRASILLGVVDDPDRQRRLPAEWRPLDDGPLVVLGVPGSGRSALLNAVAAQVEARSGSAAVVRIEGPRGHAWDAVHRVADSIGASGAPALVVVDDLDVAFAAWPDDYRFAALGRLEEVLRNARGAGIAIAASAVRLAGLGAGLRDAFTTSALLRHASRADLVHAGGAGAAWSADAPPGAGQWRGRGAQFLTARRPAPPEDDGPEALDLSGDPVVAVAAAVPDAAAATLAAHAPHAELIRLGGTAASVAHAAAALDAPVDEGRKRFVVGDADAWASNWSLASAARARATVVVHGGLAEFRSLARGTSLPPLLDEPARQCWIVPLGQPIGRRRWPPPKTTESARGGP